MCIFRAKFRASFWIPIIDRQDLYCSRRNDEGVSESETNGGDEEADDSNKSVGEVDDSDNSNDGTPANELDDDEDGIAAEDVTLEPSTHPVIARFPNGEEAFRVLDVPNISLPQFILSETGEVAESTLATLTEEQKEELYQSLLKIEEDLVQFKGDLAEELSKMELYVDSHPEGFKDDHALLEDVPSGVDVTKESAGKTVEDDDDDDDELLLSSLLKMPKSSQIVPSVITTKAEEIPAATNDSSQVVEESLMKERKVEDVKSDIVMEEAEHVSEEKAGGTPKTTPTASTLSESDVGRASAKSPQAQAGDKGDEKIEKDISLEEIPGTSPPQSSHVSNPVEQSRTPSSEVNESLPSFTPSAVPSPSQASNSATSITSPHQSSSDGVSSVGGGSAPLPTFPTPTKLQFSQNSGNMSSTAPSETAELLPTPTTQISEIISAEKPASEAISLQPAIAVPTNHGHSEIIDQTALPIPVPAAQSIQAPYSNSDQGTTVPPPVDQVQPHVDPKQVSSVPSVQAQAVPLHNPAVKLEGSQGRVMSAIEQAAILRGSGRPAEALTDFGNLSQPINMRTSKPVRKSATEAMKLTASLSSSGSKPLVFESSSAQFGQMKMETSLSSKKTPDISQLSNSSRPSRQRKLKRKRSVLSDDTDDDDSQISNTEPPPPPQQSSASASSNQKTPVKKKKDKGGKDKDNRQQAQSNRVGVTSKAMTTSGAFWAYIGQYLRTITDDDMQYLALASVPGDPYARKKSRKKQKSKKLSDSSLLDASDLLMDISDEDAEAALPVECGEYTRRVLAALIHDPDVSVPVLDKPPRAATNSSNPPDVDDPLAFDLPLPLPPTQDCSTISLKHLEEKIREELFAIGLLGDEDISPSMASEDGPIFKIGISGHETTCCWGVDVDDGLSDDDVPSNFPDKKYLSSLNTISDDDDGDSSAAESSSGKKKAKRGRLVKDELKRVNDSLNHYQRMLRDQVVINNQGKLRLAKKAEELRQVQLQVDEKKPEWKALEQAYMRQAKKNTKKRKRK